MRARKTLLVLGLVAIGTVGSIAADIGRAGGSLDAIDATAAFGRLRALAALRPLEQERALQEYYLLPAVKAQLLSDIGDLPAAVDAYRTALARQCAEPERRFLLRRLADTAPADTP